jgi:hypothetical protein
MYRFVASGLYEGRVMITGSAGMRMGSAYIFFL